MLADHLCKDGPMLADFVCLEVDPEAPIVADLVCSEIEEAEDTDTE